jgi:hypothetical protein
MTFAETEKPTNRCSDSAKQPGLLAVFALRTVRSDCYPDACPGPGTCACTHAALACADTSACTCPGADSTCANAALACAHSRTHTAGANACTNATLACARSRTHTAGANACTDATLACAHSRTHTAGACPGPYSCAGAATTAYCKQLKARKN